MQISIEEELKNAAILGFDSESKPTFKVGEISTGPHLIQLATAQKAYLFHVNSSTLKFLQPILSNQKQIKVGFGLKNDKHIFHKKGIELESCVDLAKGFSTLVLNSKWAYKKRWRCYLDNISQSRKKSELQTGQESHLHLSK